MPQKLGTGLLITRMVIDGPRTFCERMDGQWQSGTDREQMPLTLETLPECSDSVRALLEQAIQTAPRHTAQAGPSAMTADDELAELTRQLSPDVKGEMLALLRARVGQRVPVEEAPDSVADGYVYTDPETGAKRWIPSEEPPEQISAAHPCPHCQKVWASERALFTHARQCTDNPSSSNFKGVAEPIEAAEEGGASWLSSHTPKSELA